MADGRGAVGDERGDRPIVVGDQIAATITKKTLADAEDGIPDIAWCWDVRTGWSVAGIGTTNTSFFRVTHGCNAVSKIGLWITTQAGNVEAAVWSSTGTGTSARPNVRLLTSGSVACPATGYREISLGGTVDVVAGTHWFSIGCDASSPQARVALGAVLTEMSWAECSQNEFPSVNPAGSGNAFTDVVSQIILIGVP